MATENYKYELNSWIPFLVHQILFEVSFNYLQISDVILPIKGFLGHCKVLTLYQFWAQIMFKMVNCPDQDIFPKKTNNMFFMYIFVLFLLQDFKITLLSQATVIKTINIIFLHLLALWWSKINIGTVDRDRWGCTIFGSKIVHLPLRKFFSIGTINMIFIFLHLGLYFCAKF